MILPIISIFFLAYPSLSASQNHHTIKTYSDLVTTLHDPIDPVCVIVTAPWCHICKQIAPAINALTQDHELNAHIRFLEIIFDDIPEFQAEYKIMCVPTLCIFDRHGTLITKQEGIKNIETAEQEIRTLLENAINHPGTVKKPLISHYLSTRLPSIAETKSWFLLHCKNYLVHMRNSIDTLIEKCFN